MIIKNNKTGKIEEDITHEMWEKLKERNLVGKFTVIDNTDITVTTEKVVMPTDVKKIIKAKSEFIKDLKKAQDVADKLADDPPEEVDDDIDIPDLGTMKAELKDAGIKIHPNTGEEKVKEKYKEFKKKK